LQVFCEGNNYAFFLKNFTPTFYSTSSRHESNTQCHSQQRGSRREMQKLSCSHRTGMSFHVSELHRRREELPLWPHQSNRDDWFRASIRASHQLDFLKSIIFGDRFCTADIKQGNSGDCWWLAAATTLVYACPSLTRSA
jgi:hypothetical protein